VFSALSSTIWSVLIHQRETQPHSDTLSKIAKLESEAEASKIEAHKRQILKLSKENKILRETISELNEQVSLLNEKILGQDDKPSKRLVELLNQRTAENDAMKGELKKASEAVKSLQKKLAETTTLLLNKDSYIHKQERAFTTLKKDMDLVTKTLNAKVN
jgi:predicted RNase H-like nuclease (RuvC/YqgF family)